jgi:hypothetical protein
MFDRRYNRSNSQGFSFGMTRKQRLLVLAGLGISVIFLYFAFRGLNPQAVLDDIAQANFPLLLVAAAWYFVGVAIITKRWQFLLRSVKFVPLKQLFPLTCIGYMGNNVYPLRAGEILRIALLQRNHGAPIARSAVVSVTERVFDGLVMLTFVFFSLSVLNLQNEELEKIVSFTAPLFLFALVVFFALAAKPEWFRGLLAFVSRMLPGKPREITMKLGEEILAGLEGLRTPKDLFGTIVCSYGSWMIEATVYWIVAYAMNLQVNYPLMLLVVGIVNLAGLIPASPGQLGVFEFFVVTVLTAAGINEDAALAYALVVHIVIWLPVTLAGFFFLTRMGLGFGAVRHAQAFENEIEQKAVAG